MRPHYCLEPVRYFDPLVGCFINKKCGRRTDFQLCAEHYELQMAEQWDG